MTDKQKEDQEWVKSPELDRNKIEVSFKLKSFGKPNVEGSSDKHKDGIFNEIGMLKDGTIFVKSRFNESYIPVETKPMLFDFLKVIFSENNLIDN